MTTSTTPPGARPNFFVILGLDPAATWDQRAYVRALEDKRARWSRQRSGIKTHPDTVAARRNLGLLRDIERVMQDPAARDAEQRAAVALLADELRARRARVAERVNLMLAKGFLYDVEYEDLKSDLPAVDEALRLRVEAAEKRPFVQARQDQERLDQATERNLRENLSIVNASDLYAVLRTVDPGVSSASPPADLSAAADKLYQKARDTADKNRPEVGATQTLAGIAKHVFGSDELIRRHNFSMLLAPLDAILEKYERALASVKAVDSRQFELFLREAVSKGVDLAVAKDVFVGYFKGRKWSVEAPSTSAQTWLSTQVPCPNCAELNAPGVRHCGNCGSALQAECPRCGAQVRAAAGACQQCGLRVGQRGYVEYLAEEAEIQLAQGDVTEAIESLRQADRIWPLGPDSTDSLAIRLRQVHERLASAQDVQRQVIEQIVPLLESRSYRTAMRQLHGLPFRGPAVGEMLRRCDEAVRESDRLVRQAHRPGVPDERKAVLYLEALNCCADNGEALRELSVLPPAPPRRLRVEADTERRAVRLTWDPAPDAGCSSVVIRAEGAEPPTSALGHHRHVVRTRGAWQDDNPVVGRPMWYAVYTERDVGGTLSTRAAVAGEPVLLTAEPQLTARPGNREVELTWVLPENAVAVRIQREEVATGQLVTLPPPEDGARQRMDQTVSNGRRYRYTARAVFTYQLSGRPRAEVLSRAVVREVIPAAPPSMPGAVYARGYPPPPFMGLYIQKVELRCPPNDQGVVRIVRTLPGRPVPAPGAEFPLEDLDRYGEVLREPEFIWFRERERVCSFTPVLLFNDRCYAGEARRYAVGPEVGDPRAEHAGTSVAVTWSWPDGVDAALVAWDYDAEPADPVAAPMRTRVARADGTRTGRYDIAAGAFRRLFVQVAAIVRDGGTEFVSSGVRTSVDRQVISVAYEVRPGRGQRGRLILRPERPAKLPALVLYARQDNQPADRNDTPVIQLPPGHAKPGDEFDVHVEKSLRPRSCRLFVADEADADTVNIVHPD